MDEDKKSIGSGSRGEIISYLEYLQNRTEESFAFFVYVVDEIKKLDFDDDSGSEIIKSAEDISMSMQGIVDHFESLAKAASDMSGKENQRDIKIKKVLR